MYRLERKKTWYSENREIIILKAKEQYHSDMATWQKIRDHAKEAYYKRREGVVPKKEVGRKRKLIQIQNQKSIDPEADHQSSNHQTTMKMCL